MLEPRSEFQPFLVYLKYWTLDLNPQTVHNEIIFSRRELFPWNEAGVMMLQSRVMYSSALQTPKRINACTSPALINTD